VSDGSGPLPDFVEQPVLRRANRFLLEPELLDLNQAQAFAINLPGSQPQRNLLRALLICPSASIESVAALCRVDPEMLEAFETLFWNCLDRKQDRIYVARICGQLGRGRSPGNQNASGDLGPELLRIAFQDGRTELVLAKAGLAPAMPLVPAPELYQQVRRHLLVSAAKSLRAWMAALAGGRQPLLHNTDRGCQFTSEAYLEAVESVGVDVSMDGRGRWIDNRFIERLWRSVKQEDIYPHDYADGLTAQRGLARWFTDYDTRRPHQALGYATPGDWYHHPESYGAKPAAWRWK
jgi:hypothetical protein